MPSAKRHKSDKADFADRIKPYKSIEPCGCEESQALLGLLESAVEYEGTVSPCRSDCFCLYDEARVLLKKLRVKRARIQKQNKR